MKRLRTFLLAVLVFGVGYGATTVVAQVGAVLYKNPATGQAFPQQISAGYLATADGGVVNVMNSPAPIAVGRALRTTSIGTGTNQTVAAFTTDPAATTTGAGVVQFDTTLPLANGVPSAGSGTKVLRSTAIYPAEGVARAIYYPIGSGGVSPTQMSRQANSATDSFSQALTTSATALIMASASGSDPALVLIPAGTYKLRLWAYSTTNPCLVEWAVYLANGTIIRNYSGYQTIAVGAALVEYDFYSAQTSDLTVSLSNVSLHMFAKSSTGTCSLTVGIGGASSTSLSVPWAPSDSSIAAAVPLSSSVPPRVVAGPGAAGTATSAVRSDSTFGLSATNPNRGDFYRSPVGTDTATNTSVGWDHATDIPRYVGSGGANPSQTPCVPGPVLSFYYQTIHATDGGTAYGLWWKSGLGDCQWTLLAQGSGGGSSVVAISSPDNSIAVGAGGGTTTVEVNYGTTVHTAAQGNDSRITGAEQTVNKDAINGYCPLDGSALVPVANLPAGTESVAGTMSGPDKTKLDGITAGATPDSYEVAAAYGTTPGYLAAVCESTDGSITIGQTGDYVTFAANFGAGAAQVCSGATCAAKQATLPAGTNGQALVYSASGTGTTTNVQPKSLGESDIASLTTDLASKVPATAQIASGDGLQGGGAIGTGTGRTLAVDTSVLRITSTAFVHTTSINVAGGVAGLNTSGQVATANLPTHLSGDVAATSAGLSVGTGLTIGGALGTGTGAALGVDTGFVRTTSIGVTVEPNLTGPSGDFACYGGTATGTATATLVPCPAPTSTAVSVSFPPGVSGQALINATTNTSTGTTYTPQTLYESNIVGLVSDLSGKEPSLPTAHPGYVLLAGTSSSVATATTTATSTSRTWSMPVGAAYGIAPLDGSKLVPSANLPQASTGADGIVTLASFNPQALGTAAPGSSGYASDAYHVHPLPSKSVSIFHSVGLSTTVAIGDYPTWHTILSFSTGGAAGSIAIQSTVTVRCAGGGIAYAALVIDAGQIAGQYRATVPLPLSGYSYGWTTLSPMGYVPFSAGGHTVALLAYTDTTSCVVQGNDEISGGSAVLTATEYTN